MGDIVSLIKPKYITTENRQMRCTNLSNESYVCNEKKKKGVVKDQATSVISPEYGEGAEISKCPPAGIQNTEEVFAQMYR